MTNPNNPANPPKPMDEQQKKVEEERKTLIESPTPTDPQGRVKQQDSQGNFIADENELRNKPKPPEPGAPGKQGGPAIHTDSKTDFTKRKIQELETQALEAENLQGQRRLQQIAAIRAQIRELREREAKTIPGAASLTPRGSILHANEAISKRPEFHYRFVNITAPGKADNARAMGYEKVPEDEGGKTLGDLALFRISMERHAQVVGSRDRQTKANLQKVTDDLKGEVKDMAKFLQSRGVDVDPERLGVFSENPED